MICFITLNLLDIVVEGYSKVHSKFQIKIFINNKVMIASVGVTPRIFPTFTIAQKQEELESSVLQ